MTVTDAPPTKLLKGLFDRPIQPSAPAPIASNIVLGQAHDLGYCDPSYEDCGLPIDNGGCPSGYYQALDGSCQPDPTTYIPLPAPTPPTTPAPTPSTGSDVDNITNQINNNINITDTGIQQVADAVNNAVTTAAQNAANIAQQAASAIGNAVKTLASNIWQGIQSAFGSIGQLLQGIAQFVWDNLKNIFQTIASGINDFLNQIKGWLTPLIQNIASVVDAVAKQVQAINDTLIQPLANLYNGTIGTIANLTTAIERDLHDGLSGILQIPTDIANGLGSLDASLQRTVQQLGAVNKETVTSGIDYLGTNFPAPLSAAMGKALGGNPLPKSITTTFSQSVGLSSETFSQVSSEAVSALGSLLKDVLNVTIGTFKGSLDQMHSDYASVEGVFVALLDGLVGLLTTLTAMGAIANPLLDAAQQSARSLVPTAKLDPATAIAAMQRGFITSELALAEIATTGLDSTRVQVLTDMAVFLADVNTALDWWYRGIIQDSDLSDNMTKHGITDADQTAIKAGSVRLPSSDDLLRWLNFGIITQDQWQQNMRVLRYDDAQITAIFETYQARIGPEARAGLDGLLNNSSAGWINSTLKIPVPDQVTLAGARAGYDPEFIQYAWLAHWQIPNIDVMIQMYFRGQRTLTEVQQRLAVANIPQEMWGDIIEVRRPLIPFRSLAAYVKAGALTEAQAVQQIQGHGFSLANTNAIVNYLFKGGSLTNAQAATSAHTLSISNARTLWADGALTDTQYEAILVSHGYTQELAAAQLKADAISELIKQQKQTLADLQAQVLAGQMTLDDAVQQLHLQNFTSAQVAKFQNSIVKAQKTGAKIPSMAELKAFLKAGLITLDDYKNYLSTYLGWADPWLSLFVGMETPPPSTPAATGA